MKSRIALLLCAFITLTGCTSTKVSMRPIAEPSDIIINVVGDVHGESAIKREALLPLKKYFADGDLNVFNLETAITDKEQKEEKEYNFKTDKAFLENLKSIGFNVATIANNHSFDYGEGGFLETLQALDEAKVSYVGGGVNRDIAYQGQIYTVNGLKIGVLGIAKVNGGPLSIAGKDKAGTTDGYDSVSTAKAITAMRKVSDIVMVLVHWGEEGSFCPRGSEIKSAEDWQSLGADIIVGSHTHTLQQVYLQNNKLIAYSMGNFIFYSNLLENRTTGILKIRISPTKHISYEVQPFVIDALTKVPEIADAPSAITCENQAKTTVR